VVESVVVVILPIEALPTRKRSKTARSLHGGILVFALSLAWAWIAVSHGKDRELIAEAVWDHSRSLLVNHLLDVTSSNAGFPHTGNLCGMRCAAVASNR